MTHVELVETPLANLRQNVMRMLVVALTMFLFAVAAPPRADAAPSSSATDSPANVLSGAINLGAPVSAAVSTDVIGPVTLGLDLWPFPDPREILKNGIEKLNPFERSSACGHLIGNVVAGGILGGVTGSALALIPGGVAVGSMSDVTSCIGGALAAAMNAIQRKVFGSIVEWAQGFAIGMVRVVLYNGLAHDLGGIAKPHLDAPWFQNKYTIMKSLAIYFIIPMFLLAMFQAVIKGSLYFVLRAALVMLPVSFMGTVVLVFFTERLIDVSDRFSEMLANFSTDWNQQGSIIGQRLLNMTVETTGLFFVIWCVVFGIASLIIIVELVLRQTGIYLAALFMPLAFAALVWPSTAKWAKRLLEVLIGLIFSKVFIVAAISLGLSAIGSAGWTDFNDSTATASGFNDASIAGAQAAANPATADSASNLTNDNAVASLTAGAAVLIMGALSGVKVLSFAPGAMSAAENRVTNPGAFWGKLQAEGRIIQTIKERKTDSYNRTSPSGNWRNASGTDTPRERPEAKALPSPKKDPDKPPGDTGGGTGAPIDATFKVNNTRSTDTDTPDAKTSASASASASAGPKAAGKPRASFGGSTSAPRSGTIPASDPVADVGPTKTTPPRSAPHVRPPHVKPVPPRPRPST